MTDAQPTAERNQKDRSAFSRYKVMAFITGGFLLLLTLEMILKYVFKAAGVDDAGSAKPVLGNWIAFVHGWIYVLYLITVFDLWSRLRWSLGRMFALVAGGVIPLLSFFMERKAQGWFDAALEARTETTS